MRQTQRSEQRHTNMSEAKMRIARNISHSILLIAVLLSIASCATKGAHNAGYKWIEAVGLKDQKYITACGPEAKYPVAPDVRAGSKMSKRGSITKLLSTYPPIDSGMKEPMVSLCNGCGLSPELLCVLQEVRSL
jgi:hypothetical protein